MHFEIYRAIFFLPYSSPSRKFIPNLRTCKQPRKEEFKFYMYTNKQEIK